MKTGLAVARSTPMESRCHHRYIRRFRSFRCVPFLPSPVTPSLQVLRVVLVLLESVGCWSFRLESIFGSCSFAYARELFFRLSISVSFLILDCFAWKSNIVCCLLQRVVGTWIISVLTVGPIASIILGLLMSFRTRSWYVLLSYASLCWLTRLGLCPSNFCIYIFLFY
jgi:hypothetical protein